MSTTGEPRRRGLVTTKAFERDLKRLAEPGKDLTKLRAVITVLQSGQPLAARHRDHPPHR